MPEAVKASKWTSYLDLGLQFLQGDDDLLAVLIRDRNWLDGHSWILEAGTLIVLTTCLAESRVAVFSAV